MDTRRMTPRTQAEAAVCKPWRKASEGPRSGTPASSRRTLDICRQSPQMCHLLELQEKNLGIW